MATRRLLLALALSDTSALAFVGTSSTRRSLGVPTTTCLRESLWQSTVSNNPDPEQAVSELLEGCDKTPGLAFLFVGQPHGTSFQSIVQNVHEKLGPETRMLSVLAGGVVGGNMELDEPSKPSMSLLTGVMPKGADFELFDFNELSKPPPDPMSSYWSILVGNQNHRSSTILFVDPWSPFETILEGLSSNKAVVAGGISVPIGAGPSIAIGGKALPQGSAVGVCFRGNVGLQTIVAQGCRPVGPAYTISACEQNCILELDSKPALQTLEQMANSAPIEEQQKISSSLVCGIAASGKDDYLVRQLMGFVPSKNGIAIGGNVHVGDSFQFHVRDKEAAQEDLALMMKRARTERLFDAKTIAEPVAALQISCVARGRGLFGAPNVDLTSIKELLDGPVGGFYANGEIGSVGLGGFSSTNDETFLHGFTTVCALICDYSESARRAINSKSGAIDEPADAWG